MSALIDLDRLRGAVETSMDAWLPRQRWHGGGHGIVAAMCETLSRIAQADDADVLACIVRVEYDGADPVRYNIPLAVARQGGLRPSDPGALLYEDASLVIFDALADARTAAPLWRIIAGAQSVAVDGGRLAGHAEGLDAAITDIHPLVREQSNTSLVAGDDHLLKVMRKVVYEPSVELEMTRALSGAGFEDIAPAQGWLLHERDGEAEAALLALVQRFLHNGTEGWTLALTSLRDLYATAEEHGAGDLAERVQTVEDSGGSFTAEAARLGDITARMHLALSHAAGPGFDAVPITPAMLGDWADEILGDLEALIASGTEALHELPARRDALEVRINAIRTLGDPGLAIRIHGDYHLGQVLRTDAGWTVLDFEGEPRRTVEHRRRRHSPLRDVAGMLRSFDYAASVALLERAAPADPAWHHLRAHGLSWAAANREAFWAAYVARTNGSALLPDAGAALTLRRAFEIQKAMYEVGYEMAHRPTWVEVPLGFLLEATA